MPAKLRPNNTYKVSLSGDKNIDPRPAFIFAPVSVDDFVTIVGLYEDNSGSDADNMERMLRCIKMSLVGWENMGDYGDYDPDKLGGLLSVHEAVELTELMVSGQSPSGDDLKN